MPDAIAPTDLNIVCATLGAFGILFGLTSYLFKERLYLSEPILALAAGAIFGPYAANWIRPLDYAGASPETLVAVTLAFARLVLDVQLVICGVQLPPRYLFREWRSLALLLGPGMVGMWLCSSFLIWALVPNLYLVHALVVGACVTPTDPVLSNSIVRGNFAERHLSTELRNLILAESGANDGLGYPFLFLGIFLLQYAGEGSDPSSGPRVAIGVWFQEAWAHEILLGLAYGAVVGFVLKVLVRKAHDEQLMERSSLVTMPLFLAIFILGSNGLVNSDDVLACFIAGNFFTIDDFFNSKTEDDTFEDVIDMLLNLAIFFWLGAACPWRLFLFNETVPLYRLVLLGILILLFRRLPIVFALRWKIHQIKSHQDALFTGYFGPIGVAAMFYLHLTVKTLHEIEAEQPEREDLAQLSEVVTIVVWFITVCSIVAHGLSVAVGKLGFYVFKSIFQRRRRSPGSAPAQAEA